MAGRWMARWLAGAAWMAGCLTLAGCGPEILSGAEDLVRQDSDDAGAPRDPGRDPGGDSADSSGSVFDAPAVDPTPGGDPGLGEGNLDGGMDAHRPSLRLLSVEPAEGPASQPLTVTLHGEGFDAPMEVFFGALPGEGVFVISERLANVTAPAAEPGRVDVRVVRADGESAVLPAGFRYRGILSIEAVEPDRGAAEGGSAVMIRGTGLTGVTDILIGGRRVPVSQAVDDRTVLVTTPPGDPGPATVTVIRDEERARLLDGFHYEEPEVPPGHPSFQVQAVEPDHGPWEGGTEVVVTGRGFRPGASLRIGALPARSVEVLGEDRIRAVVSPGSPGYADVVVRQGFAGAVLARGYRYDWPGGPTLWDVDPDSGAWSGGARVRIFGANLEGTRRVFFGNTEASGLRMVHPGCIEVRAPRVSEGGRVPLMVLGRDGGALGPISFLYFDPRLSGGGVWGGPIRGDLNVTVLNGATGGRLSGVLAFLGDGEAPVGVTDDRGQVTLSFEGLRGPQVLTVVREGFSAATYAGFDGRNATLFLSPGGSPETGDPPPTSGGGGSDCMVEGRIRDYGKYLVKPSWLTTTPFVRCEVSGTSQYAGGPDPGPRAIPDARGYFSVIGRAGTFALWCRLLAPDPVAGGVLTLRDGLVRRLSCGPSGRVEGVEVALVRETDGEFVLDAGELPEAPQGSNPTFVIASYELGEDGWLPMLGVQQRQGSRIRFPWQPRTFEGDFLGLGYAFYVTTSAAPAPGQSSSGVPYSVVLARRVEPFVPPSRRAGGLALAESSTGGWETVPAPLARVTAMAPLPGGGAIATDASGGTWEFDGTAFQGGPLRLDRALFGVHAVSRDDLWFVGAAGTVVRLRPSGVRDLPAPLSVDLVAVAGEEGDRVTVAGGASMWSWDGAAWVGEPLPAGVQGIRGIRRFPGGEILGVGEGGAVFRGVSGRGFDVFRPVSEALRGLDCLDRDLCFGVGAKGVFLRIGAEDWTVFRVPDEPDLNGVVALGPERSVLYGDRGLVVTWNGKTFERWTLSDGDLDLAAGVSVGGRVVLAGGRFHRLPSFLGYPWIRMPEHQGIWDRRKIAWTLGGPGDGTASYFQALLGPASGTNFWTVLADGGISEVRLPDLQAWLQEPFIPAGPLRFSLTAVRAPGFSMAGFGSQDLAWDRRESFSVNLSLFTR